MSPKQCKTSASVTTNVSPSEMKNEDLTPRINTVPKLTMEQITSLVKCNDEEIRKEALAYYESFTTYKKQYNDAIYRLMQTNPELMFISEKFRSLDDSAAWLKKCLEYSDEDKDVPAESSEESPISKLAREGKERMAARDRARRETSESGESSNSSRNSKRSKKGKRKAKRDGSQQESSESPKGRKQRQSRKKRRGEREASVRNRYDDGDSDGDASVNNRLVSKPPITYRF